MHAGDGRKDRPDASLERCLCSHAESNATIHFATPDVAVRGFTMHTTHVPLMP